MKFLPEVMPHGFPQAYEAVGKRLILIYELKTTLRLFVEKVN